MRLKLFLQEVALCPNMCMYSTHKYPYVTDKAIERLIGQEINKSLMKAEIKADECLWMSLSSQTAISELSSCCITQQPQKKNRYAHTTQTHTGMYMYMHTYV